MPAVAEQHRVLLGEGHTPLVRSVAIGPRLGIPHLYFKLENLNPTGSYKDRFAAVLVSELKAAGQKVCIATSSGNTGAALAAYCAAAGIRCFLVVVDGAPAPKIKQMQLYGAEICMVKGFGKDPAVTTGVFNMLEHLCRAQRLPLPISAYRYCPSGMQGVQTIAYELLEAMERNVQHIFVPAGGGGLTLAVAKGLAQYGAAVRVNCVQPEGNDTIATPLRNGAGAARAAASSATGISGLQVPSVIDGNEVILSCRASNGNGYTVNDRRVFAWQQALAQTEGIFAEPAGAVALAGLEDAVQRNEVGPHEKVVCLVTGSGFKDMLSVDTYFDLPPVTPVESAQLESRIQYFF
ncbi:PLP-dependent lyase/thiolase [Chitinophaga sp.]|uniref:PLP-dependent lyase/thiolase n=1 Tax=Chitinophaga sp. TaxID=1869181 RepID=UPI0031D3EF90